MPHIPVADSFIDKEKTVSCYDLVLPLYKMNVDGSPIELLGSCFPIGRNVYLTAAHCFDGFEGARQKYKRMSAEKAAPTMEEMVERLRSMKEDRFMEGANVNVGILVFDQAAIRWGELKTLGFSYVTSISMALDFDVAVLFVKDDKRRNPSGEECPIACCSIIEKPHVGQKIAIAGFPGDNNKLTVTEESGKPKYSFAPSLVVNEGEILEMHPVMRDLGHAFFPCISTNATICPGHSGGPAFCKDTFSVVGINSIGGVGNMISWLGKALDAEMVTPTCLTIGGEEIKRGDSTTLRKMHDAKIIKIYET